MMLQEAMASRLLSKLAKLNFNLLDLFTRVIFFAKLNAVTHTIFSIFEQYRHKSDRPMVVINIDMLLSVLSFIAEVLSGAAFSYQASKLHWASVKPCSVENWTKWKGCGGDHFFTLYMCILFAIVSFFMVIVEVGLMANVSLAFYLADNVLRGCIYVFKGIACLGVANDLGVGCGSIEIAFGGLVLLFGLYLVARRNHTRTSSTVTIERSIK